MNNKGNMTEKNLQTLIQIEASKDGIVTFRNNVGMGWQGQSKRITKPTTVTLQAGDVLIRNARPLHAGLTKGSSDLIGWKTVTIEPEHVGKEFAIFTALEVKTKTGRATKEQVNFINQVSKAGGFAGIARSPDDVKKITRDI